MKKLLLHICCGPCATHVMELLRGEGYDVTGYFYNPNIHPEDEYHARLDAARIVAEITGIRLIEGVYNPAVFFEAVKGLEDEPENGARCTVCYRLRLAETASCAAGLAFDAWASTLTAGPQKKAAVIDPIGLMEGERAGVPFVTGDWKKKDGFRRSCELTREYGIYRQHYCGCVFSLKGRGDDSNNK